MHFESPINAPMKPFSSILATMKDTYLTIKREMYSIATPKKVVLPFIRTGFFTTRNFQSLVT